MVKMIMDKEICDIIDGLNVKYLPKDVQQVIKEDMKHNMTIHDIVKACYEYRCLDIPTEYHTI